MHSGGRNNPCGTEKQDRDENRFWWWENFMKYFYLHGVGQKSDSWNRTIKETKVSGSSIRLSLALNYAIDHPDKVKALVLIAARWRKYFLLYMLTHGRLWEKRNRIIKRTYAELVGKRTLPSADEKGLTGLWLPMAKKKVEDALCSLSMFHCSQRKIRSMQQK